MNKHWIMVFIAAFFEVFWVIGLKHADNVWDWLGTGISIAISFYVMLRASRALPVGTVYAVFVGLGTVGTVLADILFFGDIFKIEKMLLILILLIGIIGLKIVTGEKVLEGEES
ncbi:SMR family transporter [Robertmurraya sp. FSL R5-0851]|uniref:SMR family transporter n=1 Tax=Robertmurraya sp. FSL R5-0851 TaxID=2921584 RepID=UPI00136F5692